MKGTGILI